jgi:hypothetical protein
MNSILNKFQIPSSFSPVDRTWQALRFGNLVYYRNFKAASSSYLELLDRQLGWTPITINEVDWNKDHVFGHIRDPFERRIAGLAEYVFKIYQEENPHNYNDDSFLALVTHPYFVQMIGRVSVLDDHTVPLYQILGHYSELVDWIPMDRPDINHVLATTKLLTHYGIQLDQAIDEKKRNVSTGIKKQFINQLRSLHRSNLVVTDLDYDDILYQHVITFFDFSKTQWQDISWLKKKYE